MSEAVASVALDGETQSLPTAEEVRRHVHRTQPVGEPYYVGGARLTATACVECGAAGAERRA